MANTKRYVGDSYWGFVELDVETTPTGDVVSAVVKRAVVRETTMAMDVEYEGVKLLVRLWQADATTDRWDGILDLPAGGRCSVRRYYRSGGVRLVGRWMVGRTA